MRIAFIAGEYPPLQGGLGDFTRELARALAALGHEPHVLTKWSPGLQRHELAAGIQVHRLVQHWNWAIWPVLAAFIRDQRPELVNLQYQAAAYGMHPAINLLPRLFAPRIPLVVTFHDLRAPYLFPKAGPVRQQAILDMVRCATATVVTNVEDCAILQQSHIQHLYTIPIGSNINPVGQGHSDRDAWLQTQAIPACTHLVGYFGFMNESKGVDVLVRALAELRGQDLDVTLLFIGGQTGESDPTNIAYASSIMQLAEQLKVRDRIILTGYLDDRGVTEALLACECIALPYRDGASFRRGTLMAALAHQCAIVTTTPRVEVPELRHAENVLLVPPGEVRMLAAALKQVLLDTALAGRLRSGSAQLSTQFGWDRIAESTLAAYQAAAAAYLINRR